jgi:hypothetical protein
MATLTDDEYSVLMIAAQGAPMIAIGRWKPSIESLLAKKYLSDPTGDQFNCVITPEGRAAMEAHQGEVDTDFAQAIIRTHNESVWQRKLKAPPTCLGCNTKVPDNWNFCAWCGGKLHG